MSDRQDRAPIRVAMVGVGWAARNIWLPRLRANPAFEVTAMSDPDPAALTAAVQDGALTSDPAAVRILSDLDELTPEVADLAVVAVPNHLHGVIAARLLTAGVPVFVEKPVCRDSAEADQLAKAEQTGGAVLLAGSAARYRADVLALYELVGKLGPLRHIELSWTRARGVPDSRGWFTSRRLAGGGALVDLGWHLLDTVWPLLGSASVGQVIGTVSDDFLSNDSWRAAWRDDVDSGGERGMRGDVEDTVRGFLITEDGVSIALRASWASHEARDVTTIRVDGGAGSAMLRCTFGFSPNRHHGSTLTHLRAGRTTTVPVPNDPIGTEYQRQLDDLPTLLVDPDQPGRAIEEARRTVGVVERLYDSARRASSGPRPAPVPRVDPRVSPGRQG
jgi:oxidoreductase